MFFLSPQVDKKVSITKSKAIKRICQQVFEPASTHRSICLPRLSSTYNVEQVTNICLKLLHPGNCFTFPCFPLSEEHTECSPWWAYETLQWGKRHIWLLLLIQNRTAERFTEIHILKMKVGTTYINHSVLLMSSHPKLHPRGGKSFSVHINVAIQLAKPSLRFHVGLILYRGYYWDGHMMLADITGSTRCERCRDLRPIWDSMINQFNIINLISPAVSDSERAKKNILINCYKISDSLDFDIDHLLTVMTSFPAICWSLEWTRSKHRFLPPSEWTLYDVDHSPLPTQFSIYNQSVYSICSSFMPKPQWHTFSQLHR